MSDKLALSAALSVLMMAAYVLFGAQAERMPLGPDGSRLAAQMPAPVSAIIPAQAATATF